MFLSEQVLHRIYSLEHVAQRIRITLNMNQDSLKMFRCTGRFVSAAKSRVATIATLTIKGFVVTLDVNREHWRRMEMHRWKSFDV